MICLRLQPRCLDHPALDCFTLLDLLGRFEDDISAAKAYDKAAVYLYGANAITNFGLEAVQADPAEVSARQIHYVRFKRIAAVISCVPRRHYMIKSCA